MKYLKTYEDHKEIIYKIDPNYKFNVVMYFLNMGKHNINIFNKFIDEITKYNYIYLSYNNNNNWWTWTENSNDLNFKNANLIELSKETIDNAEIYYSANKYNI
jgi:hypothetical protein